MSTIVLFADDNAVRVDAGAIGKYFRNNGPSTVYYGSTENITSLTATGAIADSGQALLVGVTYLVLDPDADRAAVETSTSQFSVSPSSGALVLPWASGATYLAGQTVSNGGLPYIAIDAHIAGTTFAGDSSHWQGLTGPTGPTGNADAFLDMSTRGVLGVTTDWGPLINTAVANGATRLLFPATAAATEYPYSTALNLSTKHQITFEGASGLTWNQDNGLNDQPASSLVWKGTGTTLPINCSDARGINFRDLGLLYDNAGFTGDLIRCPTISAGIHFTRCRIGSKPSSNLTSADVLVDLNDAIVATVQDCTIGGGAWCIKGRQAGSFSNVIRVLGNTFYAATSAFIGNIFNLWEIDGNTFEVHDTPAVIDCDFTGDINSEFTFSNNWVGDVSEGVTGVRALFRQHVGDYWRAKFFGNWMEQPNGPMFQLDGGGDIHIDDNHRVQISDTTDVLIDLGDVSANSLARKSSFSFCRNYGNNTRGEAIINRTGHRQVQIEANTSGAGVLEQRTFSGHETVGFPDRLVAPTVVKGAQAPNGTPTIVGTDYAGYIRVSPGAGASAGAVAVVTFGTPYVSDFGTPEARTLVTLTPEAIAEAATCGAWISAQSATGFTISTAIGLTGNVAFNYSVKRI